MYIRYGAYLSALNEAGVAFSRESIFAPATGLQIGIKETWTITGFLQATGPFTLAAAMATLELAFSVNYMPLQLIANDGVTVLRMLEGVTPFGGTVVASPPSYLEDGRNNAEGSTYRTYRVVVEGKYAIPNVPGGGAGASPTLAWHETITQRGTGGPRFVFRQNLTNRPLKQQVAAMTPIHVVQRGQAVGMTRYPIPAAPIWPEAEHEDQREIEYTTPTRMGGVYVEYPVNWTYVFEDVQGAGSAFQPAPFQG